MSMRYALIAGGGGFIGSHLCDRLLELDYSVVAVDNFITGTWQNVAHLAGNERFQLKVMDAVDVGELSQSFDLVFHLASPASPVFYSKYPLETLHSGSSATEALLNVARRDGARFVVASTSEIYGDPMEHPQKESYWGNVSSIGPRSVYDEAKRYAEALTMAFHRSFRVNTGIVRIFNTYGPRMGSDDGRVIPAFISAALAGKPIPIHGNGLQTRSFCYVDDLVEGLVRMAASEDQGPINLGNDSERTLLSLAQDTVRLTGSASTIEFLPRPVHDPQRRRPDLSLAKEVLAWGPYVDFEEGLATTVKWYADQRAASLNEKTPKEAHSPALSTLVPAFSFSALSTPHQGGLPL
jgi:dTDP-glucose 4,6-dehydratase